MQAQNMHRKTCATCKECGMSTGWSSAEAATAAWNRRAQPVNDPLTKYEIGVVRQLIADGLSDEQILQALREM